MDQQKLCATLYGDRKPDGPEGEAAATCIPGCNLPGHQCADKLARLPRSAGPYVDTCSYPPTQLKEALIAHDWAKREQGRDVWNEMVCYWHPRAREPHAVHTDPTGHPVHSAPRAADIGATACARQVLDMRSVVRGLPATVEGFFCLGASSSSSSSKLAASRRQFLREYGLPIGTADVLLLELNLGSGGDQPFSLVED